MGKFKLLVIAAVAMAMSIGMSGMAFAAKQGSCGWCHGIYRNISSYSNAGVSTNQLRDMRGVTASPTQSSLLPADNNDVGLHGIHMNYSSLSYTGGPTVVKIIKTSTIKSSYIDNGSPGAYRKVGPTALGNYSAYIMGRGNCGYCHASSHPNHEGGFLEWSSTSVKTGNYQITTRGFIRYSSNQGGVSHDANGNALRNRISSLNATVRTGSCTAACHKGTSASNPAPWGTYTTAAIKLTCNSCHADSAGQSGTTGALSGLHSAHFASTAATPSGQLMGASGNAGCVNCHTDNSGEGKTATDWGGWNGNGTKAYPHATDGTNVVADNVTLTGQITSATKNGTSTTCATACHPRSNTVITPAMTWSSSMRCDMCHYYPGLGSTDTGDGALFGAHEIHITQGGFTCNTCHPIPTDTAHVTAVPVSYVGVTLVSGLGYSQSSANVATGNTGTCNNNCHTATSQAWSNTTLVNGCGACHEYPNVSASAPYKWNLSKGDNGHTIRTTKASPLAQPGDPGYLKHLTNWSSFSPTTDTYAGVTGDTGKCGMCHSGASHMSGSVDVNAYSGTVNTVRDKAATGFTIDRSVNGTTCNNAKCHFNRTTPNWN